MREESGFSLIEAIVALVVSTGVVVSIYAWTDNALKQSERDIETQQLNLVVRNFISEINARLIVTKKKGSVNYGEYSVRWSSELLDESQGVMRNGTKSDFVLALVNLKFEVIKDSELIGVFSAKKAVSLREEQQTQDQLL